MTSEHWLMRTAPAWPRGFELLAGYCGSECLAAIVSVGSCCGAVVSVAPGLRFCCNRFGGVQYDITRLERGVDIIGGSVGVVGQGHSGAPYDEDGCGLAFPLQLLVERGEELADFVSVQRPAAHDHTPSRFPAGKMTLRTCNSTGVRR